jgi:hypothetical protein
LIGDVATAAAAQINFEEMAAKQNRCTETQRLHSGTSLTIAFQQAGKHCLVNDVSTGFFPVIRSVVCKKLQQDIFFHWHISHPGWLASLRLD